MKKRCHIKYSTLFFARFAIVSFHAPMTCLACFSQSGVPLFGKGYSKGGAFSNLAIHRDGSSMVLDDLGHNIESHAQAGDRFPLGISDPVEALKNLVAQFSWDAQAMIADAERDHIV